MEAIKIALFASGSGTNAGRIMEYFADNQAIKVACLLSNNPEAYALTRAREAGVETLLFDREEFFRSSRIGDYLAGKGVGLVVLAGFLWLVPPGLLRRFTVINIHPALLPAYGGKNMYGRYVHEAVIRHGESFSGITIHYVNEKYDEGEIIFQARCRVEPGDTPDSLAERIHQLEYRPYPEVIEQVADSLRRKLDLACPPHQTAVK